MWRLIMIQSCWIGHSLVVFCCVVIKGDVLADLIFKN